MRSWSSPISVASVGWYPTADGMRPKSADTSEPACEKRKILSMKRRTSFDSSSRKYSAMVSAASGVRSRAPGTSFICPNTRAVFSITPDSCISRYKSFPSRVRSPTPAKIETPPDSSATFLINSIKRTVFPTPAPPKRPTFPPFTNGARRSITLMPVSKTSVFVVRSTNEGASR